MNELEKTFERERKIIAEQMGIKEPKEKIKEKKENDK